MWKYYFDEKVPRHINRIHNCVLYIGKDIIVKTLFAWKGDKMNRKRIISLIITVTLISTLGITGIVYGQSLQDVNNQKSEVQSEMDKLREDVKKQQEEVAKIEDKVKEKQAEVDKIEKDIQAAEENIETIKKNIETQKQNLGDRLRVMYKNGSVGFIDVILNSHDISEFLSNVSMLQRIYQNDQKVMEALEEDHRKMEAEKERLKGLEEEAVKAKAEVDKEAKDAKAKQDELQEKADKLKAKYQELEAESAKILAYIRQTTSSKPAAAQSSASGSSAASGSSSGGNYTPGTGRLGWPASGPITSGYGYRQDPTGISGFFHEGIDIGAPYGAPIYAAESGTVTTAGDNGLYGNCVIIDHGGGLATLYGHNSSLAVSVGQQVSKGQVIAYCGSTGNSTGPHCHFTVTVNGSYVNPMNYL